MTLHLTDDGRMTTDDGVTTCVWCCEEHCPGTCAAAADGRREMWAEHDRLQLPPIRVGGRRRYSRRSI